jgi:uncharacterized protein RhaS with RHS repeats
MFSRNHQHEYSPNGNMASRVDANGNQTAYIYDLSRDLPLSCTEAVGTPQERTINTSWHTTFRLPLSISEPNRLTQFTYDAKGNLTQRSGYGRRPPLEIRL